ncbi:type VI secretion system baseplate subunit TssK [Pigmentiphaga soli]|uniref:Type VI secretion system baseplate subunit TssK n=1 Tax=Pigmentiphaga soli TaxID=1007095 RepID=A0ABP8H3L9_9BURK
MAWHQRVIWSEGLFLQPQHFQQHDRHIERLVRAHAEATQPYGWGFTELALDEAALRIGKIVLASARGVLPDGTPFELPAEEEAPPPLDVPADAKNELVSLAVLVARPGAKEADIGGGGDAGALRYAVRHAAVGDNTVGADGRADMQLGSPRLMLLLARDLTDAHAALGAARIVERRADNRVDLDAAYVPPMLHAGASPVLASYVREILGMLHQRGDALAARMIQPGRGGVAEIADFLMLQTVNRYEPLFAHLPQPSPLHPERLYATLLQLAGDLAAFRSQRRPPAFPAYRHDDLQASFRPVMQDIRDSLSMVMEQNAVAIELQDRRHGVRVATIGDLELVRTASFVLAVNAHLPGDALRVRFPTQVKIGPVERIRDLVNLQLPGVGLRPLPVAPRQIPYHAGFNYFELDRANDLWKQLERTGNLAMHIAGEFPGLELEFWAIRT